MLPYFQSTIRPRLADGGRVIVAAHGNSLRALVMELDGLSESEVTELNIATGVPIVYRLDASGAVLDKALLTG